MRTNRREALLAICFTPIGGAGRCFGRVLAPRLEGGAEERQSTSAQPAMDNPEDLMRKDLERLSSRVYSEEGIPMFLACENLVPGQQPKLVATALNGNLASAFRRDADVWQRTHPNASVNDVAKILEMLADRDFNAGGLEKKL